MSSEPPLTQAIYDDMRALEAVADIMILDGSIYDYSADSYITDDEMR